MTTYDRIVFGMHHLNITQIGRLYDGKTHLSHETWELDLAGQDSGIDFYFNKLTTTCFKCTGRWGTRSSGNTFFFATCDAAGTAKKVLCADGTYRIITLALTHSDRDAIIGKIYKYNEVMVSEGTQGKVTGPHIHLECCEGLVTRKVLNAKGYWSLPGMLDARKVFFILDGFTTVVNTKGLVFKHCSSVEVVQPQKMEKGKLYFVAKTTSCRIRQKLAFTDGRPIGAILATMPKGAFAEVTHFTQRHEKDGYEWFQVRYVTPTGDIVNGFVQGDLKAYILMRAS